MSPALHSTLSARGDRSHNTRLAPLSKPQLVASSTEWRPLPPAFLWASGTWCVWQGLPGSVARSLLSWQGPLWQTVVVWPTGLALHPPARSGATWRVSARAGIASTRSCLQKGWGSLRLTRGPGGSMQRLGGAQSAARRELWLWSGGGSPVRTHQLHKRQSLKRNPGAIRKGQWMPG